MDWRARSIGWMVVLALLVGCAGYRASGHGASAMVENVDWVLRDFGDPGRPTVNFGVPTLRLHSGPKQARGSTGCNSFFGGYRLSGDSLRFGEIASTRRFCVDLGMHEAEFLSALGRTRAWRLVGDTLVLSGEDGVLARFHER